MGALIESLASPDI